MKVQIKYLSMMGHVNKLIFNRKCICRIKIVLAFIFVTSQLNCQVLQNNDNTSSNKVEDNYLQSIQQVDYPVQDTIICESDSYKLIHIYDITTFTNGKRSNMDSFSNSYFNEFNKNFSRLYFVNKKLNDTVWKSPCISLTHIKLDTFNKIIIGVSTIFSWNPFNIVLFSFDGKLIYKKKISEFEAKLDSNNLCIFKDKFPNQFNLILKNSQIYFDSNYYYIPFGFDGNIKIDSPSFKYLVSFAIRNHLFPKIVMSEHTLRGFINDSSPIDKLLTIDGDPIFLILKNTNSQLINYPLNIVNEVDCESFK